MVASIASLLTLLSLAQQQPQVSHVVVLKDSDVAPEQALAVFAGFGVDASKAKPLLQKVASEGDAIVIAGPEESCKAAAAKFEDAGMAATVRAMTKEDMKKPSLYSGSDVIEADAATFKELMDSNNGALVAFYAPWCGHCHTMAGDFKKVATSLKGRTKVAAVNSDEAPGLAQSLGIRGFPSVLWVSSGKSIQYSGQRTSMEMTQFAQQQATFALIKGKAAEAVQGIASGVKAVSKMAMSKVLGGGGGAAAGGGGGGQASPTPENMHQPAAAAAA